MAIDIVDFPIDSMVIFQYVPSFFLCLPGRVPALDPWEGQGLRTTRADLLRRLFPVDWKTGAVSSHLEGGVPW